MQRHRRDCYTVHVQGVLERRYVWARFVLGYDARRFAEQCAQENPSWTVTLTWSGGAQTYVQTLWERKG